MRWTRYNFIRLSFSIVACALLAACGGGGGGGHSPPPFVVSLNQSSVNFDYRTDAIVPSQTITATWTGEPPENVYIGAVVEGQGIDPAIAFTITNSNATARISPSRNLAAGEYTGRILFLVCTDFACANRVGGSPLPLSYTVRVRAPTLVNTLPITFRYILGAPASNVTQTLSTTSAAGNWTASSTVPWIQLSATQGSGAASIGVNYNPAGLAEGTYKGQVTVTGGDGYAQSVAVTLIIVAPDLFLSSQSFDFVGTLGTAIAEQTLSVEFSNHAIGAWTITSSPSWLTLDKVAGSTPDSIRLGINRAQPPPSGNYRGEVVVNATLAGRSFQQTIAVTLTKTGPRFITTNGADFYGTNGSPIADRIIGIALSNGVIAPVTISADQPWITPRVYSTVAGGSFSVGINQALGNVGMGTFGGTIRVATVLDGEVVSLSIPVSLTLSNPALVLGSSTMIFSGVNGATIAPQSQTVHVDNNAPITLELQSNQPWLHIQDTSAGASNSFSVSVDPAAGMLPSGGHAGELTIGARLNGSLITRTFSVTLGLTKPVLTLSQSSLLLGGAAGRDSTAMPLSFSINTGSNSFTWNVSGVPAWVSVDRTSGSISATTQSIALTPRRAQSTPGTANATLTITTVVNGDTITATLPVAYNLDAHKLITSEVGVAFTSAGAWSRLTRTIHLRSNFGLPGTWSATSNRTWLSVTASGSHGGDLQLIADPSTLSPEQLYEATVTVTSSDNSIINPEVIHVGLWVGTTVPSAPLTLNGDYKFLAADPIRPYLYAHGDAGGDIRVINFYTGAQIAVIALPTTALGPMAVTADGAHLLVMDRDLPTMRIIDLATRTVTGSYTTRYGGTAYTVFQYFRTNGVGLVRLGADSLHALDGTQVSGTYNSGATGDGRFSFAGPLRYTLDYTDANGGTVLSEADGSEVMGVPLGYWSAANVDGSRVMYAASTSGPCRLINGATMTDLGQAGTGAGITNNVAVSVNGASLCTLVHQFQPSSADNFWLYDASGALEKSLRLSLDLASQITDHAALFSGDGFISAVATQNNLYNGTTYPGMTLHLIPVGP